MNKKAFMRPLSKQEMRDINGGSWLGKVWDWLKNHFTAKPETVSGHGPGCTTPIVVGGSVGVHWEW